MAGSIRVEQHDALARVWIDYPEKHNALTRSQLARLAAAFDALGRAAGLRAVVLSGAGERAFVGGASLDEMASLDAIGARSFIEQVHVACDAVRRCPVPVIARVRGHALGAGLELAASCDLRVAADDALFGMPEVRFGIPSVVEAALLPRMIGRGRAAWLLLTGQHVDAQTALRWGLVERVVPAASLDAAVDDAVRAVLAMEPQAVRAQKALLRLWDERPLAEGIEASIDAFARSYAEAAPNRLMREFLDARRAAKRGGTD